MTTYRDAGVDIEAGDEFVSRIASKVRSTFRPEVLGGLGGFGGLFRFPSDKYKEPVLVSGTDGVGTKLKLAVLADRHDTIGIDLVAMCVNDICASGAEPLFFLDYLATGRLEVSKAEAIVSGIVTGCREAGCALIGGETAEMPSSYPDGEYDLAGFAVGVVERADIIDGSRIKVGDVLVGLPSTGLHSNGFTLARKVLLEEGKLDYGEPTPRIDSTSRGHTVGTDKNLCQTHSRVDQALCHPWNRSYYRRRDHQQPSSSSSTRVSGVGEKTIVAHPTDFWNHRTNRKGSTGRNVPCVQYGNRTGPGRASNGGRAGRSSSRRILVIMAISLVKFGTGQRAVQLSVISSKEIYRCLL